MGGRKGQVGSFERGLGRQAAWAGLVFAVLLLVSAVAHAGDKSLSAAGAGASLRNRLGDESADLWQDPPEPFELLTILGTNDLHGAVDPHLPDWAGAVRAIREGQKKRLGARSNVLLVDAGDQFQGTLLSNFNEGKLVFDAYSAIGYDAVVPGNHDYDFGPEGWLYDKTGQGSSDPNPRGVIEKLARLAAFPLLSANTYLRESLHEATGGPVVVTQKGCLPVQADPAAQGEKVAQAATAVAWDQAIRPAFLQPYVIRRVGSARVALIGLDNPDTGTMTTIENVSDLCFRDMLETYREIRSELEGQADVFVAVMHHGSPQSEAFAEALLQDGPDRLHAIFSGHTHRIEKKKIAELIPVVQSGANGEAFSRVDFVFDPRTRKVDLAKTRMLAGGKVKFDQCAESVRPFCHIKEGQAHFEGWKLESDSKLQSQVALARDELKPVGSRVLGVAENLLTRDRTRENPLANVLTDALKETSGADIAFLNMGGLRADIPAGDVTYEAFFRVLPFNNRAVVMENLDLERLIRLLRASIATCGASGALMQSGLRIRFERECQGQTVASSRLVSVQTVQGDRLYDAEQGVLGPPDRRFRVATLDFLAAGGSGYSDFIGVPVTEDLGILRERLVEQFLAHPARWQAATDGRWRWLPTGGPKKLSGPSGAPN